MGRRTGPALVLLSSMLSVGAALPPFIVNGFIDVPVAGENNHTLMLPNDTNLLATLYNSTIISDVSGNGLSGEIRPNQSNGFLVNSLGIEASIEYPYGIVAGLYLCSAFCASVVVY